MKEKQNPKIRTAVVGARGYSGLELARILLRHPEAELTACFAHDQKFSLSDYLPEASAKNIPVLSIAELNGNHFDTVFLATPTEASLELAPELVKKCNVIDLSGAFRFKEGKVFEQYYKVAHKAAPASYGLVPFSKTTKGLVANPGCYATAVLMAIIPLLKAKAIFPQTLVIDAKSGTSGAGRKAAEAQLFNEVDGECLPYRVGKHQHLPEIQAWAKEFSGVSIDPFFNTHLLPVRRGIIASMYAEITSGADVGQIYREAFKDYPLVRVTNLDEGQGYSLSLKKVAGSARTHLSFSVQGKKLYFFSLIDNLLKGAASQAVENFNSLHDFPAALGLESMEGTL